MDAKNSPLKVNPVKTVGLKDPQTVCRMETYSLDTTALATTALDTTALDTTALVNTGNNGDILVSE